MKKRLSITSFLLSTLLFVNVSTGANVRVFETSRTGSAFTEVKLHTQDADNYLKINVFPDQPKQSIVGFGSSFTESAAYVLNQLSDNHRAEVIETCFSESGARFSLTRTHIASCDFSVSNYSYTPNPDAMLADFSIHEDEDDLIPLILDAKSQMGADFKIIASPWTAPTWMKDNHDWNAGKLLPEHYATFASYTLKYLKAYKNKGIDIWGITPINEPHGNGGQWESMEFTGEEMADYVENHLGPTIKKASIDTKIFIFDQNREQAAIDFVTPILESGAGEFVDGIALHWYNSTVDYCPDFLDTLSAKFPNKPFFHSEGCIDAMGDDEPKGAWLEDDWYWRKEATDWGYFWATEETKKDHPPYRPFYRYARDIIGGLNHGFFGWVDWNLALDFNGGPNHADNFCGAPILIDTKNNEVYYTPLFFCLQHFSKFIRPGAKILTVDQTEEPFMFTAAKNPDGSIIIIAFNMEESAQQVEIRVGEITLSDTLQAQSLKTYVLEN